MVLKRRIITGYNRIAIYDVPFQSGGTVIMAVDEVTCRSIAIGQELQTLSCWSLMMIMRRKNSV